MDFSGETRAEARNIIREVKGEGVLAGRSPDGIVASALYISAKIGEEKITQKEIANAAGVTEVTVRKGYQHLAEALGLEEELED